MKKTVLILSLAMLSLSAMASESRFVLCDSTHALLSGVKMEFLNINSLPVTSSWDGLIRYNFPDNVKSAQVMFTGAGVDTLRMTISPAECPQWIVLKRRARIHHETFRDIYYSMDDRRSLKSPTATGKTSKERTKGRKPKVAEALESEIKGVVVEEEAFYETADVMSADGRSTSGRRPRPEVVEPNNLQAGKLTAGEVNDFAKWHLWKNILTQSHAQFVADWKMNVSERYRVQITNVNQFPLADVPVALVDAKGDTLFRARTDNTGHAELWANVLQKADAGNLFISCAGMRRSAPKRYPEENVFVLDQPCNAPDNVDVFFIMDATGSMGDELRYMNAELQDVIRRSQSAVEGVTIRTGAMVYRDHSDDYLNRLSALSEDMSITQAFLNAQQASGGGDYEEAVPEALMAAVNVAEWSTHARARIAFLILDAPCHQDSATLELLHKEVLAAAETGIRIVPVVCSGLRESGELLMRELALLSNGTSFFLTDDSGIGDTHLKPTTDSLKVEHLNDMLVRTIIEFSRMPDCTEQWADSALNPTDEEAFVPNPFSQEDLEKDSTLVPNPTEVQPVRPVEDVLNVRPNPCKDFFLVDLPLGADAAYLVDITGKTLQALGPQPANAGLLSVNVSGYATGIYFIKAFVEGNWYTRKVIVK